MNIITKFFKSLLPKPAPKKERGFLFLNDNIRKVQGEELNNIKITIRNYVGDDILTRLISSKANQIKDEAIKKCHNIIEDADSLEDAVKKAGLIMLGASFKVKGLNELVEEIRFFARKDTQPEQPVNPHEHI